MIIKRDGTKQKFDINKVVNAIHKALLSNNLDDITLAEHIAKGIDFSKTYTVEGIQDLVEQALMETGLYPAARNYITYRNLHNTIRQQAQANIDFIHRFIDSDNTANATIDDNSNVGTKGIGVLNAEIHKESNKNTNIEWWEYFVKQRDPQFNIKQMREDFKTIMYPHDSSSQIGEVYCMSASLYPMLSDGLAKLGGKSATPKSLESFCGIYINLNFALASEIKGAVATPEFLMYFDYFARKEWGDNYYQKPDVIINNEHCLNKRTLKQQIEQYFQQVTYSINQVAGSRGMQSPFTNFSFFDKYFFIGMFEDFYFPDGTQPKWESTNWLQQLYLHWLNQERLKCILTFPVCSYACLISDSGEFKDIDTYNFICTEYSEGNSFFTYLSNSVDSLSSCCRLQNAVQDNTFNFTNGQVGIMTGSKNVITLNLSRIAQDWYGSTYINIRKDGKACDVNYEDWHSLFKEYLINILNRVYLYQEAYNDLVHWCKDRGLYAAYDAGFIDLDKQYLTIGVNALNQAAEFLGMECTNNESYKDFCKLVFGTIKEQNKLHKTKHSMYNTEQTPCESAAIKLYNRDKQDGYWVPEDTNLYASYIYKPNDPNISILDKIRMHSSEFAADYLDGGVSAHLNLSEHLTKEQYSKLLNFAAEVGCKYFTFNVPNSECEDCGYICKQTITKCPKCGSTNISLWDRIIGYLTKIKNWSAGRQIEQKTRVYSNLNNDEIKS